MSALNRHLWRNQTICTNMLWTEFPVNTTYIFCKANNSIIITSIHIDDFLPGTSSDKVAVKFKADLATEEAKFCVGIAIKCDLTHHHIYLLQTTLIDCVLVQFKMSDADPVTTPMEIVLSKFPPHLSQLKRNPSSKWSPIAVCYKYNSV